MRAEGERVDPVVRAAQDLARIVNESAEAMAVLMEAQAKSFNDIWASLKRDPTAPQPPLARDLK